MSMPDNSIMKVSMGLFLSSVEFLSFIKCSLFSIASDFKKWIQKWYMKVFGDNRGLKLCFLFYHLLKKIYFFLTESLEH